MSNGIAAVAIILLLVLAPSIVSADSGNIVTGNIVTGNTVEWSSAQGDLVVWPHTSNGLATQVQYANLTWKLASTNLDVAFKFQIPITGRLWLWRNISHSVTVYDYGSQAFCSTYTDNATLQNVTACQSLTVITGSHTEQSYYYDWDDISGALTHTVINGSHYYWVTGVAFAQGEMKQVRWQYAVPINSAGKWSLFVKRSQDTLETALANNVFVELDPWWNASWAYKKIVTIVNNNPSAALPSGYTVNLTFDHASLVSANQSLASGDDVRVVYNDATELDRINVTTFNTGTTTIVFRTQANISAGGASSNYELYYGNPGAGSPPVNGTNVYLLYDDFSTNTSANWIVAGGTWSWNSTDQIMQETGTGGTSEDKIVQDVGQSDNVEIVAKVRPDSDGCLDANCVHGVSLASMNGTGASGKSYTFLLTQCSSQSYCGGGFGPIAGDLHEQATNGWGTTTPYSYSLGTWYYLKARKVGKTLYGKVWVVGTSEPGDWTVTTTFTDDSTDTFAGLKSTYYAKTSFDDVVARKYLSPEPSATFDTTPPTTTSNAPVGWQKTAFNVTLTCTDSLSGCSYTTYRVDGGSWTNGTTISITTDGNHTLGYYSVDVAGNAEATNTAYAALDTTPPTLTVTSPANTTYQATYFDLNFTAVDPYSGVAWTGYSLDGGPNVTSGNATIYGNKNGSHRITVYANDTASNLASSTVYFTLSPLAIFLNLTTDKPSYAWNNTVTITATISNHDNVSHNDFKVNFSVRNPNAVLVHNDTVQVQNINPGQTKSVFTRYVIASNATLGTYAVEARLFDQTKTYDITRTTFQVA